MIPDMSRFQSTGSVESIAVKNKVLRNTYMLLSASMIPTVLGAYIGINSGFSLGGGLMSMVIFMGIAFGFFYAIEKTKNSPIGVYLLLAFTFFMGLMLSRILGYALGASNGPKLIAMAAVGTGGIFFGMSILSTTIKKDLAPMGKFLFIGMILLIVASVANIFLQMPALMLTISLLAVAIFSAFLLYDLQRIVNGGETNYVTATLSVYLSIYNIFSNLLFLLMAFFGGDRE
jgi:FtsH-binding integral membrane protein